MGGIGFDGELQTKMCVTKGGARWRRKGKIDQSVGLCPGTKFDRPACSETR